LTEAQKALAAMRTLTREFRHNRQPTIHLKPSLNSIGANCICM
jgi:hypothetical protein